MEEAVRLDLRVSLSDWVDMSVPIGRETFYDLIIQSQCVVWIVKIVEEYLVRNQVFNSPINGRPQNTRNRG